MKNESFKDEILRLKKEKIENENRHNELNIKVKADKEKAKEDEKNKFISECDELKNELNNYIDNDVDLLDKLKEKVKKDLVNNDYCLIDLHDYILTKWQKQIDFKKIMALDQINVKHFYLTGYVRKISEIENQDAEKINEFLKSNNSYGDYRFNLNYKIFLPYGEQFFSMISYTHFVYDVNYFQKLNFEPDSNNFYDEFEVSFNANKLIEYFKEQSLNAELLNDKTNSKIKISLN